MPSTGESLEALVASIEAYLLGEGFNVETRVRMFDDAGVQTGEIDVQVTGAIGSSSVHWVFECRDRPSDGPAGIEWIEQLIGRRSRLKADKIFAVSTTGFSGPAQQFAEDQGIVLRTVADIGDIQDEFLVKSAVLIHQYISKLGEINLRTEDGVPRDVEAHDPKLRRVGGAEWRPLTAILDEATPEIGAPLVPDVGAEDRGYPITSARVFLTEAPYEIDTGHEVVRLTRLRIAYEATATVYEARALTGRVYAEGGREIGREGVFDFETPSGRTRLRVQLLPQPDGDLTMRVMDESDAGMRLRRLTVWGSP